MEVFRTYAALVAFALLVVGIGLVVLLPTLLAGLGVWYTSLRARRVGRWAAILVVAVAIAGAMLAWHARRGVYLARADATVARIAAAPKLGRVDGRNLALLVDDSSFTEVTLPKPGCFPDLWFRFRGGGFGRWDPRQGAVAGVLPTSYLEFDLRRDGKSAFGDRSKTGARGPYELWLVDGGRRQLVDVLFLTGDGQSIVPPAILLLWAGEPEFVSGKEFRRAMLDFLQRTTGRCGGLAR